jgi:hypothetical protein
MLSKSKLATVADFTAKVLLDRETQTGYVRGIVEFPNRLPATDTGAETIYAPVVTIVADEFRLSRTEALASLAQIATAKPDVFGWQPERRTIRLRDKQTGQPTGETQERDVHHLWLKSRMQARMSATDPLARAAAETRARVHASLR